MGYTLKKSMNDIIGVLQETQFPGSKKVTIWEHIKNNIQSEGRWDEEIMELLENKTNEYLTSIPDKDLRTMWERTDAADEKYLDSKQIKIEEVRTDVADEIINMVMDKASETDSYEDDYEVSGREYRYEDDEDEFDDKFDVDDDDEFYMDDDRY